MCILGRGIACANEQLASKTEYRSFSKWRAIQGEHRVTAREEAGDSGRVLGVVEKVLGLLPRALGSHSESVSKGGAGAGLHCEGREGDRSEE